MTNANNDDGFEEAFKGFGEDPAPVTPPKEEPGTPPVKPEAKDPSKEPAPKEELIPEPAKEPKKDEQADPEKPEVPEKKEDTPPADDATKKKEEPEPSSPPESKDPEEPEKPLTKEDVTSIIQNVRTEERTSFKEVEATTQEVLDAYYPDGLSNVLTDTNGRELKTPADVVEATGGKMSTEEATQWLMNEQFKLDKDVEKIREDARKIAETTINFKRDAITAVKKYEPLFKEYPYLQQKVFDKLVKQVKADEEKNVILSAPDVMEHYDDYLEPYMMAFEHSKKTSATNPTPDNTPPPPKPKTEDRLDETGDGGTAPVDDPNDFGQQVKKELAKGI